MRDDARKLAVKFAVKNAMDYGKADAKAVLSKVLASEPALRESIGEVSKAVSEAVDEVNKMSESELRKEFEANAEEFERRERERRERSSEHKIEAKGARQGEVVTRFPPEPGGYIQIGNIKQAILSEELAKRYGGSIYLYFDDTNPEKCRQEYVEGIRRDTEWMGIRFEKEYYASDFIKDIYEKGRELLAKGHAYVCTCGSEKVKKERAEQRECEHRHNTPERNTTLFDDMLNGKFDEGGAIVRFRGDMKALDATFRDPTLFRIKKAEHYRQGNKYLVWPTYHINTPVIDNINGVTDVIRGKEYEIWDKLDNKILSILGLKPPRFYYEARLQIKESPTAKRIIRKLIKEKLVSGWDDPRLLTIVALRRRGIRPEAIRNFVLRFGMSKTDSTVSIGMLLAENRSMIDAHAKRLFAVTEPAKLSVEGLASGTKVGLKLHPSKDLGSRECSASGELLISGSDAGTLSVGSKFRLKDLVNVEVKKAGESGIEAKAIGNDALDAPKFQWVDARRNVRCKLTEIGPLFIGEEFNSESLKERDAYAEEYVDRLGKDEIVQFERIGFFKLDDAREKKFIGL